PYQSEVSCFSAPNRKSEERPRLDNCTVAYMADFSVYSTNLAECPFFTQHQSYMLHLWKLNMRSNAKK
ncbi:MAG: hypothetical protein AB2693_26345, partial [Candidatus Thiodiazotropha sp.]